MWQYLTDTVLAVITFQSTHPRRVWPLFLSYKIKVSLFQSTHPRRVWHSSKNCMSIPERFQSTHPRRVWPQRDITATSKNSFNPHTHAGCDYNLLFDCRNHTVSIHTPTQGVTQQQLRTMFCLEFQSTHPRRVWHVRRGFSCYNRKFQSTHPRRVWPCSTFQTCEEVYVSIHTPTQGVTFVSCEIVLGSGVSIHTPTQGVTKDALPNLIKHEFQSTHPRRVWLLVQLLQYQPVEVSIHTPTQGVTQRSYLSFLIYTFQSTHPRRVWHMEPYKITESKVSIHTPTQGVTVCTFWNYPNLFVSIHTPTQGVTSTIPQLTFPHLSCFNPHTHAGCDF